MNPVSCRHDFIARTMEAAASFGRPDYLSDGSHFNEPRPSGGPILVVFDPLALCIRRWLLDTPFSGKYFR